MVDAPTRFIRNMPIKATAQITDELTHVTIRGVHDCCSRVCARLEQQSVASAFSELAECVRDQSSSVLLRPPLSWQRVCVTGTAE